MPISASPGSSPLTDGDVVLLVVLALTNAGMFAAASMAWRFPLTRTSTIDDLLRLCPDRGSIVGVIAQGYRWQFVLPLVAAAIPIVLHLHSGDVGSLRAQILAANLAWTMFLFGNVSWWLIVPPLVAIKLRSCRHVNLRWNDPARTPGIRTLAEGYAYPALFLALAAFAVALPGLMGYEHLLGRVQPYLYGWLLVLSLWVGAVTQLSIFLIVRRFRLRMMDTLAPGNEYNISEEQVNAIFARVQRQIESTAALSAYNSVAAAPGLPYGTGLIVQYVATVVGSVASFLLQWYL